MDGLGQFVLLSLKQVILTLLPFSKDLLAVVCMLRPWIVMVPQLCNHVLAIFTNNRYNKEIRHNNYERGPLVNIIENVV